MTYDLYIGDRTFSSWSLRGWLMFAKFNIPYRTHMVGLYSGTMAQDLEPLHPACLVPVVRTPQGDVIGESLAIAETLAEQNPTLGLWPSDPALRMRARWLCAEMASGFTALRSACPMQLAHVTKGFEPSEAVLADLARIETLWNSAWELSGSNGEWLFGAYSLADVFYAPVVARIVGYDLPVSEKARAYCYKTRTDTAFQVWRNEGLKVSYDPFPYPAGTGTRPWPET